MHSSEILGWCNGIYFATKKTKIVLDPVKSNLEKDVKIFITHAHADHTNGFSSSSAKYSTGETKDIYQAVTGKKVTNFQTLFLNQPIEFEDITVTGINAGHMLGSTQYKITTPEQTILYTGDINCTDTLITEKAESIECDTAIIEATYGNPFYIFPNRERVYAGIVKWLAEIAKKGRFPFFQVYAAGKAQEIIRLINLYTTLPVLTNHKVAAANKIYNANNTILTFEAADEKSLQLRMKDPFIYVTSSSSNLIDNRFERAKATGWLLSKFNKYNGAFPLSAHADFNQLTEFIKET